MKTLWMIAAGALALCSPACDLQAQPAPAQEPPPFVIDLPAVLRLARAQNLDIQVAREHLAEAQANYDSAVLHFFPWLSPGLTYRRHDDSIQDVAGRIIDVHKQSYAPGATIGVQLELGDAIYRRLAARQDVRVFENELETQRQNVALSAVENYFDLLFAQSAVSIAEEAVGISTNQASQTGHAVGAGLAFKGDQLRVDVQVERNRLALRQAVEGRRRAGTRLAQTLHLDPSIELLAQNTELAPVILVDTNASLSTLVMQALRTRPETRRDQAAVASHREAKRGASYGPWIPSAGAQYFAGGLGGDSDAGGSHFGAQEDLFVGLSWKIGPGGLLDSTRVRSAEARLRAAELNATRTTDDIARQVVDAYVRVQSLKDQIVFARRALTAAEEALRLSETRKEFAVGAVLEKIQSEQDLTHARYDYLRAIVEFNKAQYVLSKSIGNL